MVLHKVWDNCVANWESWFFNMFWNFTSRSLLLHRKKACISFLQLADACHPLLAKWWKESRALLCAISFISFMMFLAAKQWEQHLNPFVFLLLLCRVYTLGFSKIETTSCDWSKKMKNNLFLITFEWRNMENSLNRTLTIPKKVIITAPYSESWLMSKMTTAANCKTYLDDIVTGLFQGDDSIITFQPMGIFLVLEKQGIHFFPKMSTAPLFSVSTN